MKYDVIAKMQEANIRHTIAIDEEHVFTINSGVPATLKIQQLSEKQEQGKEINTLYDIIGIALGKEAREYIESKEYTVAALTLIVEVISAAINDSTLEEMQEKTKNPSKS